MAIPTIPNVSSTDLDSSTNALGQNGAISSGASGSYTGANNSKVNINYNSGAGSTIPVARTSGNNISAGFSFSQSTFVLLGVAAIAAYFVAKGIK